MDVGMNTMRGKPLTTSQLTSMAVAAGHDRKHVMDTIGGLHNEGLVRSWLLDQTASYRFSLMMDGELTLDTSQPYVATKPQTGPRKIDPFWFELRKRGRS